MSGVHVELNSAAVHNLVVGEIGAPERSKQNSSVFVRNYDAAKSALQAIVDMPDRLIDLFIRLCIQNKGVLSAAKRNNHFAMLTDEGIAQMQQTIKDSHLVD